MNKGSRKYHLSLIVRILLPAILFMAIGACKNDPNLIKSLTGEGNRSLDRAEDVTIIQSKDGKVQLRLFAREFVRNERAKPAYLDMNNHLRAEFYNDSGQLENVLTADSSRYYESQGNILVWDSVQIVSRKGEKLNTQELIWNESAQKFFTEKPVKITTPTEVIYGTGMEANRDFTWYQITYPRGTVQVNKNEMPQ